MRKIVSSLLQGCFIVLGISVCSIFTSICLNMVSLNIFAIVTVLFFVQYGVILIINRDWFAGLCLKRKIMSLIGLSVLLGAGICTWLVLNG